MSYIDFHTHIGPLWYGREPYTPDEMLGWMDEREVERIVVLPLESPESSSYYILTETVLSICAQHPDRFVPFCVIDARMSVPDPDKTFAAMIERFVERGAKGFGEVKVGLPVDDPQLQRLYAVCDELRLPVLLHLDGIRCTDDTRLTGLEAMLQAYPNATFIGHAPGFWSAISGDMSDAERNGYPSGKVAPGGAVERLLTHYPNLYGDLSAGSGHNAIMRDREFGRGFLERCANKLLFATDILMKGQETPQFAMMEEMALPAAAHEAIAAGNARRLLGL
ncbi:MAG: amidohydrolase family protein [Armatimonadetes bacterium]|nr:amidohydrolase family protein [Armatimonadota bacterium]